MSNQFLDTGLKDRAREMPNPDPKQGFIDAVKNAQPRLAMSYLINVLNIMGEEINELKSKISELTADKVAEDTPTAKRPRSTKAVEAADEPEA